MSHQWPTSALSRIRVTTYGNVGLNLASVFLGGFAASGAVAEKCSSGLSTAAALVCGGGGIALVWLLGAGWAQASAAAAVVGRTASGPNEVEQPSDRKLRRKRYNRWLAWARSGFLVTALQTVLAALLSYQLARALHTNSLDSSGCPSPSKPGHNASLLPLTVILTLTAWLGAILPCVMGHDVLNWRSLYEMQDMAWRAHYHEVFDRNIRQMMCCLGRIRYWKASEDDEINAVAALTADILAYRAKGATHLDLLAGLNLMRAKTPEQYNFENLSQPPVVVLQEAAFLQPFAVAAYTGPVLDVGRNPFLFCCTWTYRQGVLTPWNKSRYPVLEGDNLIRGHAAAFLRYIRLPPECLRKGRVKQKRHWEAAYFVVVVPEHRCVVVAVRGTETPEDVLTDALGREVELGEHDLGGLSPAWSNKDLAQEHKPPSGKKRFAHKGVVIAARELAYQLDGMPYDDDVHAPHRDSLGGETERGAKRGLLSELLGPGGECEGYSLRFVGHSLGGGISTVTALRLRPRFPQLHVFAFNTIPSLDQETADACSKFVTSVIYNNDWASRISVASVMRLRAAALRAQSAEAARQASEDTGPSSSLLAATSPDSVVIEVSQLERKARNPDQTRHSYDLTPEVKSRGGEPEPPDGEFVGPSDEHRDRTSEEGIHEQIGSNHMDDSAYPRELFVPGTIVHVIRVEEGGYWPTPRFGKWKHRAVVVDRSSLREMPIHASMFLDHLPWRLQGALNELLEIAKLEPPPFGLRLPSWFKKTNNGVAARQTCLPVGPSP